MMEKMLNKKEGTTLTVGADWEQRFLNLVATWKRDRGPHSSSARLAEHPAYQQIIALGPEVIPLVLRELEREPDHWFRALHVLTGADPVPSESRGKVREMTAAWLRWGQVQFHLSPGIIFSKVILPRASAVSARCDRQSVHDPLEA
jgi:hypothetical protein